jgi:TM2 domain-containing membrane protein YozV
LQCRHCILSVTKLQKKGPVLLPIPYPFIAWLKEMFTNMPISPESVERTCPYCGAVTTSEDFFCRACHRKFELRGTEKDHTREARVPEATALSLRNPAVAAFLSFTGMGLGQFYNGDTIKGIVCNAVYLPVVLGYLQLPYSALIISSIWLISVAEAAVAAWRINHFRKEFDGKSPLFWILAVLLSALIAWYMVSGDALVWVRKLFPAVYLLSG